ncbi:MAG: FtsW/RodA/SpoVE family cell cycle protein, partial [Candidatus Zixiibacteriota bacterium]
MRRYRTRHPYDERLLYAYLLVLISGLVMVYSTSSIVAESRFGSHLYFLKQQTVWAILSLLAIYVIGRLDLKRLSIYAGPALLFNLLLLALVFTMPARNGSHRWIMIGMFTVQPSELFKFLMIAYLAFSLANTKRNIGRLKQLMIPYVPIIGLGLVLILFEPDLGNAAVICMTALGVFFLAGARVKHLT